MTVIVLFLSVIFVGVIATIAKEFEFVNSNTRYLKENITKVISLIRSYSTTP